MNCPRMSGLSFFQNNEHVFINFHKDSDISIHKHDFIEISYVLKGRGIHYLGNRQIEIEQGDYFIINTHVPHGYKDIEKMTIYNCIFKADFLDASMLGIDNFYDILDHYLFKHLALSDITGITEVKFRADNAIHDLFMEMYKEYTQKPNGYVQLLRLNILKLLILTLRANNTCGLKLPSRQNESLNSIIRYITQNYQNKLTLKELASRAYVSPEHFCRTFKNYTGVSVWNFIKTVRIDKAKSLLLNTNKTVAEVAELVGYTDEKHFSKIFRLATGISPSGFKKHILK